MMMSHTGLDSRLGLDENIARMMRPRLISKEHAKAFADVVVFDHECIGTDTKLTAGRGRGGPRIGERTNEARKDQQSGFYYAVVDAMLKTGFGKEDIGKVGGGNFCRVFDLATGGRS